MSVAIQIIHCIEDLPGSPEDFCSYSVYWCIGVGANSSGDETDDHMLVRRQICQFGLPFVYKFLNFLIGCKVYSYTTVQVSQKLQIYSEAKDIPWLVACLIAVRDMPRYNAETPSS